MVSAFINPVVPSAGRQPETLPFSLTNKKRLPLNDAVLLKTCPVHRRPGLKLSAAAWWWLVLPGLRYIKSMFQRHCGDPNGLFGAYAIPHAF